MQFLIAEAEPFHGARREVLDQHVGAGDQPAQDFLAAVGLQVEHDAALVAVHHQEGRGLVADLRRHGMPGVVAVRPFLDLDDVGAHVGEHQGAGRTSHHMGEIDDLQAGQRAEGWCWAPGTLAKRHLVLPARRPSLDAPLFSEF